MTGVNGPRGTTRMTVTLVACGIGAALTACGSSGSSGSPSTAAPAAASAASTTPAPASSAPASAPASSPSAAGTAGTAGTAAAEKTIAANWTAFFNPKEPVAQRIALLEDGPKLAAAVMAQAKSTEAAESSSKVVSVAVLSASTAKVTYDILLNGTPVLKNQSGSAVLQGGTWKVADSSFCGLLALQGTKSLPAACQS